MDPTLIWWHALDGGLDLTAFSWSSFVSLSVRFVSSVVEDHLVSEFLDLK